jgi:hypothetical protein
MRGVAKTLAVTAVVLTLTACSTTPAAPPLPALSSKNVSASMVAITDLNLLTGDDVPLAATVVLSGKRKDKVVLRIEKSTDGTSWSTVDEVKAKGPKVDLATHLVVSAAGPQQFRASAVTADKKAKTISSSAPQIAAVFELQQLVRTFFYDQTHSYDAGTQSGITFDEQHTYPNFADFQSQAWKDQSAARIEAKHTQASVPTLTTISPDPTWKLPASSCSAAQAEPPAGRTSIVSIETTDTWNGFPTTGKYDVHVTFFNGQIYKWINCG